MPYSTLEGRRGAYRRNPEPFKARTRAYRAANREEIKKRTHRFRLKPFGRAAYLLESSKRRAQKRELPFDLTREWVQKAIENGCSLSGFNFVLTAGEGHHPYAPSIDRLIASAGYTQNNCRVILWCLNTALGEWGEDLSIAAWKAVIKRRSNGA